MSGLTGYLTEFGTDLSYVFMPLSSGTQYSTETGFKLSDGSDLNTVFAQYSNYASSKTRLIASNNLDLNAIFNAINYTIVSTITGTGAKTTLVSGNTYTYTFTGGTNEIKFNQNIPSLNVIVCGGGGGGGYSSTNGGGGGAGGGGYGVWNFSYTSGTIYTSSVGVQSGQLVSGLSSVFKTKTTPLGVTATGGMRGYVDTTRANNASGGTCSKDESAPGTLIAKSGGNGGGVESSGTNSDGIITVLGINYNYGGGGASGTDSTSTTSGGGKAGANGVGATTRSTTTSTGQSATTIGSGAGGANRNGSATAALRTGGSGANGRIIVSFVYPL